MKKINKVLQGIIAAVATVAMALVLVPSAAFADTATYKLTLNGTTTGHTYEAYQIFSGDLSSNGNSKVLSNVQWGSGIDSTKYDQLINALKNDDTLKPTFGSVTDAKSVAEALSKASNDDAVAKEFAQVVNSYLSTNNTTKESVQGKTEISGLNAGYYLVKDKDKSLSADNPDAYTRFVMAVLGDAEATVKSSVPTVEKKVKDTNDSTGTTSEWQDSADADINDDVQYQITGTMPSNIADYTTYKYVFTDTMSKGLTYTAKNAKIMIGTTDVTSDFNETVTANTDGTTTVIWACNNLKSIQGVTLDANTKVVVTYSAKLNENAVLGSAGNPNTVTLTYSNNPNKGGEGETGTTPKDKNIVFTYKVVVNKVDQDKKSLAGAAFKLEKKQSDGTYKIVKEFTAGTETSFEFTGLDDGDYRLTETTTPAGYNTITPIEFTISAEHDETSDNPALTKLIGDVTSGTATFTADTSAGSLTTNVVNKQGSTLPSTGGMGTTILYVVGAAIVAAAGYGLYRRHSARTNA